MFLLALLLYVCFISLDKIYNYDQIFSKSHYTTILRSSNIFISVIISILLLRKYVIVIFLIKIYLFILK